MIRMHSPAILWWFLFMFSSFSCPVLVHQIPIFLFLVDRSWTWCELMLCILGCISARYGFNECLFELPESSCKSKRCLPTSLIDKGLFLAEMLPFFWPPSSKDYCAWSSQKIMWIILGIQYTVESSSIWICIYYREEVDRVIEYADDVYRSRNLHVCTDGYMISTVI